MTSCSDMVPSHYVIIPATSSTIQLFTFCYFASATVSGDLQTCLLWYDAELVTNTSNDDMLCVVTIIALNSSLCTVRYDVKEHTSHYPTWCIHFNNMWFHTTNTMLILLKCKIMDIQLVASQHLFQFMQMWIDFP